jgi:ribosomal protein S18 acetylase RimI-like enzyme
MAMGANDKYIIEGPGQGKSAVCEPILRSLPDWFGIERSIAQYVKGIETMPTLIAKAGGEVAGFLAIKKHNDYSAEIYIVAVRSGMHRRGIGNALMRRAEELLSEEGVEYLQVKTRGPSKPDEHYERTRAFHTAMGFRPLEEFADIWDKDNPCLLMVKFLGR